MVRSGGAVLAAVMVAAGLVGAVGAGPAGASPNGFALLVDSSEPFVCQLAGIDLATGAVTPLAHTGSDACASDIAETSDGRVFGIQQQPPEAGPPPTVHLLQYNTSTGAPTDLGQIGTFLAAAPLTEIGGVTFDHAGNLFVEMVGLSGAGGDPQCSGESVCLYRVDPANPASATFVGQGAFGTDLQFFSAPCDGPAMTLLPPLTGPAPAGVWPPLSGQHSTQSQGSIHALDLEPNSVLASRDLSTGAVSAVGSGVGVNNLVDGLAFDSSGTLWGIGGTTTGGITTTLNVFTLNTTSGAATPGPVLSGNLSLDPLALALPLTCPTPAAAAPAAVVITPTFTG
jgi:hypothetical protein